MIRNTRKELTTALLLVAPFVIIYAVVFIYPSIQMFALSFTDAPLIGEGKFVGFENYERLLRDRRFKTALWNTSYFVLLTVVPGTLAALAIALMVNRLKGFMQSMVLALFFLPYILPVSVIYLLWDWIADFQFGISQHALEYFGFERIPFFLNLDWFMPTVALVTIWWTNGFSILLFIAALRSVPEEIYEAASLDNARGWTVFRKITLPIIWPVTSLVLTIQLILQLKIFDQVYLFGQFGRPNETMVLVQYVWKQAFVQNYGGRGAAVAVTLFVLVVVVSVLNYQILRSRGEK